MIIAGLKEIEGDLSLTVFVIPIVAALLVTIILSVIFRGSDKVDKGFKLNYFKLSYRRKLIRTLISVPVIILALIVIYSYTEWSMATNVLLGLLFFTIYLVQLIYNYFMWKQNEK